jgi:class 3 adenylate cyclase/tetratricopeptide (TPR) repeat protein
VTCPSCRHENAPGARFCDQCAASLLPRCPSCGAENAAAARFCNQCAASVAVSDPDPRAYTPRHLAEKILGSRATLEGERKQVTVLFADVKGSMDLAEGLDPEEFHQVMDGFLLRLAEGVHRFEGTVNQYTGDGIMALFGAPIAHEDHAQRACWAALHLSDELRRYANELRLQRSLNFSVRMGLNSGWVVVGKIGDDLRMDYTAQGHTVGLAARMEQIAEPGKVYLTEHTAALVRGYVQLVDLGRMAVKGVQAPLGVYELQGAGHLRTRLDVSRSRGFSRFVGRVGEMAVLEAALARAREGQVQVVGIVGEAGFGKSRLCAEFVERCRAAGLMTHEAHGVPHGKAIPFLPVLELFRAFFGVTERDSDTTAREKIAGRLLLIDETNREFLPVLFEFLGVADPERPSPYMDPEARQRRLYAMVRSVIQARAGVETEIVLLEDLHWFDGGSDAFLDVLLDLPPNARGLFLVNFRPEYRAAWMAKSYYQQIALLPLGAEATGELLDDLLGRDPSLGRLAETIHARTAGNPFFIEEVVQALVESGNLEGTRGAYRLVTPVEQLGVPDSVHAVLAARIDRLSKREKEVLQAAAVIGREFAGPILEAVVDGRDLTAVLERLKASEFVYETALYPVVEYVFKHPLTQEVALGSLLRDRRQRLHAAVARAIEAASSASLEEHAALLAHHWEEADDALQAARWHRRAAEHAGISNLVGAAQHWRRIRALLRRIEGTAEATALQIAAGQWLLGAAIRIGMGGEEAAELLTTTRRLAEQAGDRVSLACILLNYGMWSMFARSGDQHEAYLDEVWRVAAESENREIRRMGIGLMGMHRWPAGKLRQILPHLERAISLEPPTDVAAGREYFGLSPYLLLLVAHGLVLSEMGMIEEAARQLQRLRVLAGDVADMEALWAAHRWLAVNAYRAGDAGAAMAHAREAMDTAEKIGSTSWRAEGRDSLGLACILDGDPQGALAAFEEAVSMVRERRVMLHMEPPMLAHLSQAHLASGDAARACTIAEEAIAVAHERRTRGFEIEGHLALARALLRRDGAGDPVAAREALDRALALAEETGAQVHEPFIRVERAKIAALAGDEAARRRELGEARRLFTEMGAPLRAQRVEAELTT